MTAIDLGRLTGWAGVGSGMLWLLSIPLGPHLPVINGAGSFLMVAAATMLGLLVAWNLGVRGRLYRPRVSIAALVLIGAGGAVVVVSNLMIAFSLLYVGRLGWNPLTLGFMVYVAGLFLLGSLALRRGGLVAPWGLVPLLFSIATHVVGQATYVTLLATGMVRAGDDMTPGYLGLLSHALLGIAWCVLGAALLANRPAPSHPRLGAVAGPE